MVGWRRVLAIGWPIVMAIAIVIAIGPANLALKPSLFTKGGNLCPIYSYLVWCTIIARQTRW